MYINERKRTRPNKRVFFFFSNFVTTIDCQRWQFAVASLLNYLTIAPLCSLVFVVCSAKNSNLTFWHHQYLDYPQQWN